MKKKADSRVDDRAADNFATTNDTTDNPVKKPLFIHQEQTAFLTSLLGTQLLLTTSPPDYPIIKATEVETEEIS